MALQADVGWDVIKVAYRIYARNYNTSVGCGGGVGGLIVKPHEERSASYDELRVEPARL